MSLADLRTLQTSALIRARIVAQLQAGGLPVNDWTPSAAGGVENIVLDACSKTLAKIIAPRVVSQAEMRFLDLASADALTIYARKRYKLERNRATVTIQNVILTSVTSAPAYKFKAGDVVVAGAGGNIYRNIDPIDLKPGSSVPLGGERSRFQADQPGSSYNDVAGTITKIVKGPAGLTCVNQAPADFEPTTVTGSSSGKVTAAKIAGFGAFTVNQLTIGSIRVKITAQGEVGGGYCLYSVDGGATWIDVGPIPSSFIIPDQAEVSFANGTAPSFVKGDIFTMLVSDAILQRGADEESDESLRQRCRYRWASLSDVPVEGLVSLWCQLASPEVHRVRVDADVNTPGGMLIMIAAQGGPASPAAVIAVQDYVAARLNGYRGMSAPLTGVGNSPEETAQVSSAHAFPITPTGTVQVPRSKLREVQQEADRLWNEYLGKLEIGGMLIFEEIVQAIMDAGAIDVVDPVTKQISLRLNDGQADIQLTGDQVAVPPVGVTLTNALVWQAV